MEEFSLEVYLSGSSWECFFATERMRSFISTSDRKCRQSLRKPKSKMSDMLFQCVLGWYFVDRSLNLEERSCFLVVLLFWLPFC